MKLYEVTGANRYFSKVSKEHHDLLCRASLVNPNASWRERSGLIFTLTFYGYTKEEIIDIIVKNNKWKNFDISVCISEIEKAYTFKMHNMSIEAENHKEPQTPNFYTASFSTDDYYKTFIPTIIKSEKNLIPPTNLDAALYHWGVGRHPIPRGFDKKPAIKWKEYQDRQPTRDEILSWDWSNGVILLGTDRDCFLDVDEKGIQSLMKYKDVLLNGNHWEKTRHGYHIFGKGQLKTKLKRGVVEIRGKGAYIVTYPTEGYTI